MFHKDGFSYPPFDAHESRILDLRDPKPQSTTDRHALGLSALSLVPIGSPRTGCVLLVRCTSSRISSSSGVIRCTRSRNGTSFSLLPLHIMRKQYRDRVVERGRLVNVVSVYTGDPRHKAARFDFRSDMLLMQVFTLRLLSQRWHLSSLYRMWWPKLSSTTLFTSFVETVHDHEKYAPSLLSSVYNIKSLHKDRTWCDFGYDPS